MLIVEINAALYIWYRIERISNILLQFMIKNHNAMYNMEQKIMAWQSQLY